MQSAEGVVTLLHEISRPTGRRHDVVEPRVQPRHGALAKRATKRGPVFITDRGKPSHVLLAFDDYVRLAGGPNIVELLTMPTSDEMELEVPRARGLIRKPDLS